MKTKEQRIKAFLGQIGKETWLECGGLEFCPKGKRCGTCRFEYMKKRGWLNVNVGGDETMSRGESYGASR